MRSAPAHEIKFPVVSCFAHNCHNQVTATVYNRRGDQFRTPHEPIAQLFSCDQHLIFIKHYCHASESDVTDLRDRIPA